MKHVIAVRLGPLALRAIEEFIVFGRYKNRSQFMFAAVRDLLQKNGISTRELNLVDADEQSSRRRRRRD